MRIKYQEYAFSEDMITLVIGIICFSAGAFAFWLGTGLYEVWQMLHGISYPKPKHTTWDNDPSVVKDSKVKIIDTKNPLDEVEL